MTFIKTKILKKGEPEKMENTTEKQEFEFSLISFLKIFKGKVKMLVAIGLVCAIIGGAVGVLVSTLGKKTYGNLLAFYFPTPEQTGYSAIIPLLESDLFIEKILIGTKEVDGVKIPDLDYSAEQQAELVEYETKKLQATNEIKELKKLLKTLPSEIENAKARFEAAESTYTPFKEDYEKLWAVYNETLAADAQNKITELSNNPDYKAAKEEFTNSQNAYSNKKIQQAEATKKLVLAENVLVDMTEKSNEIVNKLRAEWRKAPENKKLIENFHKNVTYSFTKDGSPLQLDSQAKEDTSGKFVYINVAVPENINLANEIISNISAEIGEFVIANTTPVEKNDQIECKAVSTGEARDVNQNSLIKNALVYALIFLLAAEVITGLVIIAAYFKKNFFSVNEKETDVLEKENINED